MRRYLPHSFEQQCLRSGWQQNPAFVRFVALFKVNDLNHPLPFLPARVPSLHRKVSATVGTLQICVSIAVFVRRPLVGGDRPLLSRSCTTSGVIKSIFHVCSLFAGLLYLNKTSAHAPDFPALSHNLFITRT